MSDKFEFIDVEYAAYRESGEQYVPSIVKMCIWMEVSRSGFYEWRDKPESATAKRRGLLALYIRKSFEDSDDTYGYRRVHADLVAWGMPAGPELVRSLMRELGLEPCQPRPWRVSLTEGDGQEHDIPDLVRREFTADAPGEKMVGDITYIPTWEGWLYLATVIDCHTKAVIGWAADDNYKTPLIEKAIEMAARNYPLAEDAIFHSDRGSNYTSCQFAKTLKRYGLRQSAGRTGICYDNAMAESFFAALKNERRQDSCGAPRFLDTRYDTGRILTCQSRRLVDVCGDLHLDVTQPEMRGTSMTALHRRWLESRDDTAREKITVLNLRHSLSTAMVAARAAGLAHWQPGLNANQILAAELDSAFGWLAQPDFTALLGDHDAA